MVVEVPDTVIAVAAGAQHSLALGADGRVWICGVVLKSKDKDPVQVSGLKSIIAIAAGAGFSLALRADGTVWSWGVIAIAAGVAHSLALRADGTVRAWGGNGRGELGDGSANQHELPIQVPMLSSIVAIAAGEHALALHSSGTVWAWGANSAGQLGNDTTGDSHNPTPVLDGPGSTESLNLITAIAAGGGHSLAITADGEARAWGNNYAGQLGDGTEKDRHTPVAMKFVKGGVEYTAKVTALAGGGQHTLAIVHTGGGWGWGANGSKQLGNPLIAADESETAVHQKLSPKTIAAGSAHGLEISGGEGALGPTGIYDSGDGWAWGSNDHEQVKPGDMSGQPLDMTVTLGGGTAVAAGGAHSLELLSDGIV
jgi:alpha-tubulin suppressor-like RCC1 family protein